MLNSNQSPTGSLDLKEKTCAYCGEIFYSTHGLQQYCPEKFGKKDYCKYEQKKMVSETKLVELVNKVQEAITQPMQLLSPLEKNIQILESILGPYDRKQTDSERLDALGYQIGIFSRREFIRNSDYIVLTVGPFELRWTGQVGDIFRFKITRL